MAKFLCWSAYFEYSAYQIFAIQTESICTCKINKLFQFLHSATFENSESDYLYMYHYFLSQERILGLDISHSMRPLSRSFISRKCKKVKHHWKKLLHTSPPQCIDPFFLFFFPLFFQGWYKTKVQTEIAPETSREQSVTCQTN